MPVRVFVDDLATGVGLLLLSTLRPRDIYLVEFWENGTEVRVFTNRFIDRVRRGKATLRRLPPRWRF